MPIENFVIQFGAAGTPQTLTIAEQVYAAMPVGLGAVTQDRWRCNPVTVGGIAFTAFPGMDSDGRADVWIYAAYGEAAAPQVDNGINRQFAAVDLRVTLNGVAQTLFGAGTTYSYNHQRATWLRWESGSIAWDTSHAYIQARIDDGIFLRHDSRNVMGATENTVNTDLPASTTYQPFKAFATWDQIGSIGDSPRKSVGGGERTSIGPAHEWFARLISEVGTNNNPAWLTATRLQVLKNLADSAGQFPHASGLLEPVTNRLLDPSVKPHCTHGNPVAWYTATGIPQPGGEGTSAQDGAYDNAHPYNKFSFQAWHLSHDPFHLLQVQGQAVAALAYTSLYGSVRGADGKTLLVGGDQERGNWWGLQMLIQAWHATPAGAMPKPFRDKAWFATAINNSLQWLRDKCISATTHQVAGVVGEAMRFWRVTSELGGSVDAVNAVGTHFQEDYGHIVLAQALMLGYSGARDVAEWHVANLQKRLQLGGNWYLNDPQFAATKGLLAYAIGPRTGTLPYTDLTTYKAWYPTKQKYVDGALNTDAWTLDYGRDTYLFMAAVNVTKEAARRGLLTPGFDVAAAETELKSRFTPPYTSSTTGGSLGYAVYAKQYYSYPTGEMAASIPPQVPIVPASTVPMTFVGGALGSVPLGVLFLAQAAAVEESSVTGVTLTPAEVTMAAGQTQQFDVVVEGPGTPSQEVTWSEPSAGVLSSAGFFTAPPATNTEQKIDIIATSTQDPGVSGMATVTIPAASAPENPGFSRSKTRTIKIKAAPLTFEGSRFWDLTDPKHPVGTIDPDATIDISFDWTEVLADITDTLASVQFDIDGLTSLGGYFVAGYATIFVTAPTDQPRITCRVTTNSVPARVEDRTVFLKIEAE